MNNTIIMGGYYMEFANNLQVRNENIQRVFDWYTNGLFIVNRKYQRKLVWTLEEKQKFINSITLNYPVPLFLLATINRDGKSSFEIIDGMQRLDAIFSFIQGEIPVFFEGTFYYFDLATMAKTKELLDSGTLVQYTPVLKREVCSEISNYQLPISITSFEDSHIEEVFRRINATGRQLSDQDLRQAGATGAFSDIVRKLSAYIRRDSSPEDTIELSKMKKISLSNRQLAYGINLNNVFWVKQEIISVGNMRISRDEELIAYLLIYILLGANISPTARNLNIIYGYDDNDQELLADKTVTQIEKIGSEKVFTLFVAAFDEVERILNTSGKTFNELLFGHKGDGKPRSFQVLFLSIFKLITDGYVVADYAKLISKLDGAGTRLLNNVSNSWNGYKRDELVNSLVGVISECFIQKNHEDPAVDMWVSKLENLLMQSKIEQQLFDFKIGLHALDETNGFNEKVLKKITKTLIAMANSGKNVTGYVLVGVADDDTDAAKIQSVYGTIPTTFNGFYITGIQGESSKWYHSMDEYYNKVKQLIENEPIDADAVSYILRNMRLVNYYDKSILVLSLKSAQKPLLYDNAFYERHGANVAKIDGADLLRMMERFQ